MMNLDENEKNVFGWGISIEIDCDHKKLRLYMWQPTTERIPQNILFWKNEWFLEINLCIMHVQLIRQPKNNI